MLKKNEERGKRADKILQYLADQKKDDGIGIKFNFNN
jgi:hypothetical protein